MGFKNIVVTGASGMLGQELMPYLTAKGYTVHPFSSSAPAPGREAFSLLETEDAMREKLALASPEIIVHCAAYTQVDQAEAEPELAMAINKDGARKLALAARELGAILLYISTDYVFDGLAEAPYQPGDRPNPVNTYGLSKYYGELMVSELMDEYYVVRTSWLFGIHRGNFVQSVLENARAGRPVRAAEDWIGSPTWVGHLCVAIENIMNSGVYGIHHAADAGVVSRYDQARAICHAAGFSSEMVERVQAAHLTLPAQRPRFTPLACPSLTVPSWETGFQAYWSQYRQRVPSAS